MFLLIWAYGNKIATICETICQQNIRRSCWFSMRGEVTVKTGKLYIRKIYGCSCRLSMYLKISVNTPLSPLDWPLISKVHPRKEKSEACSLLLMLTPILTTSPSLPNLFIWGSLFFFFSSELKGFHSKWLSAYPLSIYI